MNDSRLSDQICIVSYGCILPGASNPDEYWHNLLQNNSFLGPLPQERWSKELFYSMDRNDCDKSYSHHGAVVNETFMEKIRGRFSHVSHATRMQLFALEAARQALSQTSIRGERTSLYLGCMSFDESVGKLFFFRHQQALIRQYMSTSDFERFANYYGHGHTAEEYNRNAAINSTILHQLKQEFGISGFSALVDAACASSLVAFELGVSSLLRRECDCAVVGGADSSLGPESFIIFCRAGVMAEKHSMPFSLSSEGLLQGEGSVMFVLKRLNDAVASGDTICAIIGGAGFSSNSRSSSLFQLSVADQVLAYERAYGGSTLPTLDFIEAHATGTLLGDDSELRSIQKFFQGQHIALSSTKAMIGHTKATAGAASLLKAILMIKYREIPPFLLSDGSRIKKSMACYLPVKTISPRSEVMHGAVSAFGFGGINAHVYIHSFTGRDKEKIKGENCRRKPAPEEKIVLVGHSSLAMEHLEELEKDFDLRIPVKSLPQVERLQRLAVIATDRAFRSASISIEHLDRASIGVICGNATGFEVARDLVYRLYYALIKAPLENGKAGDEIVAALRKAYPQPTKDTGPGMLKNVIAGRVANYFDFKSISFAIDHDSASEAAALSTARTYLQSNGGFIVVIGTEDTFDLDDYTFTCRKVNVFLLCTLSCAKRHCLPIISVMKGVSFHDC